MATINHSSGADIIVPSNNGDTYRGLAGDDTKTYFDIFSKTRLPIPEIPEMDTLYLTNLQATKNIKPMASRRVSYPN